MPDSVHNLELFNPAYEFPCMYSGFINAGSLKDVNLFYTLIRQENLDENAPLVLWLNGNPRLSSQTGLFLENGPLRIVETEGKSLEIHSLKGISWTSEANMLYLDYSVGTGYSYGDNLSSLKEIEGHIVKFLDVFCGKHPEIQNKIYIASESNIGNLIPNILQKDSLLNEKNINWNKITLGGLIIGSGMMNPKEQIFNSQELAFAAGITPLDLSPEIDILIKKCEENNSNSSISDDWWAKSNEFIYKMGGEIDNYDIRWPSSTRTHAVEQLEDYLNFPEVIKQFYAEGSTRDNKFSAWNSDAFDNINDIDILYYSNNFFNNLFSLSNSDREYFPVFIYNGNMDMKFGKTQQQKIMKMIKNNYEQEFLASPQKIYYYKSDDGSEIKLGGNYKQIGNFNFLTVYSSGHLMPASQLALSRNMLSDLISSNSLQCHKESGDCSVAEVSWEHMNYCNGRGDWVEGYCVNWKSGYYGADCSIQVLDFNEEEGKYWSQEVWSYYKIEGNSTSEYIVDSTEAVTVYTKMGDIPTKSDYDSMEKSTDIYITASKNLILNSTFTDKNTEMPIFIGIYNPSGLTVSFSSKSNQFLLWYTLMFII